MKLKVAPGTDPSSQMGPLVSDEQRDALDADREGSGDEQAFVRLVDWRSRLGRFHVPELSLQRGEVVAIVGVEGSGGREFVASLAAKQGLSGAQWASFAGLAYNFGAVAGYIAFGFCADAWGRKPVTISFFVLAWILTPVLFLWTHNLVLILIVSALSPARAARRRIISTADRATSRP